MNLGLLNILVSVFCFLLPLVVSYTLLNSRNIRHSFLYSVVLAIILGSLFSYLIVGALFP